MSFSSTSKYSFRAQRSGLYFYCLSLICALQVIVLLIYPAILPLGPALLVCSAFGFKHWYHYQPQLVYSAAELQLLQEQQWQVGQWGPLSRVGLGFCLIEFTGEQSQCLLIFQDSLADQDYRRLCFSVNFHLQAQRH